MTTSAEAGRKSREQNHQQDPVDSISVDANARASEVPAIQTPLSETERRVLVDEIVREMRKDALKEQAAEKLTKLTWAQFFSNLSTQPAVLLVLGFALTGLVGTFITGRWQKAEWDRQQTRLVEIQGINLKYQIIDDVTKLIGERNAAALAIVVPLLGGDKDLALILKEEEEPIKNWQKVSHDWRANSQILRLKIAVHIQDAKAGELFARLIQAEKELGGKVTYLEKNLGHYIELDDKSRKYLDDILSDIDRIGHDLKELVTTIANEARNDIKNSRLDTS
jgi:hypothetical protein